MKTLATLILFILSIGIVESQIPMKDIPRLDKIWIVEHTYGNSQLWVPFLAKDPRLSTRLTGNLDGVNSDFVGWPGHEFYDVFWSDADGNFAPDGAYLSVEAQFGITDAEGGLNIIEVIFKFETGKRVFGKYVSSAVGRGGNYVVGSEVYATDCDLYTWSTMGSTYRVDDKLRITIGVLDENTTIIEKHCTGSGFEMNVNGTTYNEAHPTGIEVAKSSDGCDTLFYIGLTFVDSVATVEKRYNGCMGDGYEIEVNGTTYNEFNSSGIEIVQHPGECDSVISVDLEFIPCDTLDCRYFVPNVFSANGDGVNDVLRGYYDPACVIQQFKLNVFDRWGDLVFSTSDPDFSWSAQNQELTPGVYVYLVQISYEGLDKPTIISGDVTLIR